jgi:hypothetical protein
MSEYAETEQGFAEQLANKLGAPQTAPEASPEAAPETPQEQPVERGRDERGRFAPQQEQEQPEEQPQERLYAGKYKSEQELENAYLELQQRMGSQGSELGDVRGRLQQMEQALYQQQYQQSQPQYNYSLEQVVEAAEQNPQQTAVWAIQNAPHSYDTVMDVWYQVDAKGASRFEQQIMAQALRDQIRQEMAPAIVPAMQMSQQNDFYQAWSAVAAQNPEINQHTKQILEAAESAPEVVDLLRNGDLESKQRVITQLYWMARGRNADTLAAAAQGVMQEQNEQNQYAKNQAQVVTSSGTSSADTTSGDRIAAWKRQFREAAGLPADLGR